MIFPWRKKFSDIKFVTKKVWWTTKVTEMRNYFPGWYILWYFSFLLTFNKIFFGSTSVALAILYINLIECPARYEASTEQQSCEWDVKWNLNAHQNREFRYARMTIILIFIDISTVQNISIASVIRNGNNSQNVIRNWKNEKVTY